VKIPVARTRCRQTMMNGSALFRRRTRSVKPAELRDIFWTVVEERIEPLMPTARG
jgi:hypothetical protein